MTRGGWVGVALAPWIIVTLALLCVAGALPRWGFDMRFGSTAYERFSFTQALRTLIGGKTAGGMVLGFGLVALRAGMLRKFPVRRRDEPSPAPPVANRLDVRRRARSLVARHSWTGRPSPTDFRHPRRNLRPGLRRDPRGLRAVARCVARRRVGWNGPGVLGWGVGVGIAATMVYAGMLGSKTTAAANLPPFSASSPRF